MNPPVAADRVTYKLRLAFSIFRVIWANRHGQLNNSNYVPFLILLSVTYKI